MVSIVTFSSHLLIDPRSKQCSSSCDQRRSVDKRTQIALIICRGLGINQALECCLINEFHAPCDFLGTSDLQPCTLFNHFNELGRFKKIPMCSAVEPVNAA